MIIYSGEYSGESIVDIEEVIYDVINEADLPIDEYGFTKGTFTVTISWSEDE